MYKIIKKGNRHHIFACGFMRYESAQKWINNYDSSRCAGITVFRHELEIVVGDLYR